MRVAIVHYWLLGMRGGERFIESLCRILPQADIFTLFYEPGQVSETIRSHRVTASFLNPVRRFYRQLLPLMPLALEQFDLREYDLIISSESGPAKGVLAPSGARHVCYCHTPMRYIWELYPAYLHEFTRGSRRWLLAPLAHYVRLWDFSSAARVDEFVANSANTQRRIRRSYRRESVVIYPPVRVETFYWRQAGDYCLMVGELVAYKRFDTAVRAFSAGGRRLCVVGDGPEYKALRRQAGPSVEFCGRVPDRELRDLYAGCRALVMPGEEDFGLAPVEALASGKPVIGLARGGVLESVPTHDPRAGFFYDDPSEAGLDGALRQFDKWEKSVRPAELQRCARRFSEARFEQEMRALLAPATGRARRASR